MEKTLLLSKQDIDALITLEDVLYAVDKTYVGMGEGSVLNPTKVTLDLRGEMPGYDAYINAMPAYVDWTKMAGLKWAGGWHGRPAMGLPFISSMIFLLNAADGKFVAVMDGEHITTLRTGAQAVISTAYFRQGMGKDLSIGLFGCGAQGHMQTKTFAKRFDIKQLRIYDISAEAMSSFKEEMRGYVDGDIVICNTPEEVASPDLDILISFTHGSNKFITNEMVYPGQIVFPMGSFTEVSDELLLKADKIIVDHIEQCIHRGALVDAFSNGQLTEKDIFATIGEIAAGTKEIGELPSQRIVCVPIGTGAMDVAVASLAYQHALEKGVGGEFCFV